MENIKTFLESSTIHGLSYISTSRKCLRIFWVLTIILGFTSAGILIYQSFLDWHDNPETTTIAIRPIEEINFPKVTVCPPKNTYTNLNYDLMMTENLTLTKNNTKQLLNNFGKYFHKKDFDKTKKRITNFKEKNKYRNWYNGLTEVPIYLTRSKLFLDDDIRTSARSGEVSSPYFGTQFDEEKFPLSVEYRLHIMNHFNDTCKLVLNFKYDILENFERIYGYSYELNPKKNEDTIYES